jgi:phosphatidylglycerol lysyltransferase
MQTTEDIWLADLRPVERSTRHAASHSARTVVHADERHRIEEFAYVFGNAPESYDIVSSGGSVLKGPSGDSYVNVYADRKYWHIPGGIIAGDEHKPPTVEWLKQIACQQRRTVAVYSVKTDEVPLFHEAGFAVNKFGEEPVIDLEGLDWQGRNFEWVRRQTNFCRRQGLNVCEIHSSSEQQLLAEELTHVFYDDLRDRVYSQPLQLLEGRFDPHALGRRRLFIARQKHTGRTEGFLVASPMDNGTSWAFETYRKRRDAIRGTIPYLFREVADRLQAQGVRQVSLCLVPGRGVKEKNFAGADARVCWLLDTWYGRLNFLFNVSGQDYFKSRFRPRYLDRYVCVYPRNSWSSIASFMRTSGALGFNKTNLIRQLARSVTQSLWRR